MLKLLSTRIATKNISKPITKTLYLIPLILPAKYTTFAILELYSCDAEIQVLISDFLFGFRSVRAGNKRPF